MIQVSKELFFVLMVVLINSCALSKYERTNELTKYKDDFYWENQVGDYKLKLYTDSAYDYSADARKYRHEGVLIINDVDSMIFSGFKKGEIYPNWIRRKSNNTTDHFFMNTENEKVFFIHQSDEEADTLFFNQRGPKDSVNFSNTFYLLKKSK